MDVVGTVSFVVAARGGLAQPQKMATEGLHLVGTAEQNLRHGYLVHLRRNGHKFLPCFHFSGSNLKKRFRCQRLIRPHLDPCPLLPQG